MQPTTTPTPAALKDVQDLEAKEESELTPHLNSIDKEPADDADERSVFVKGVHYNAEPQELKEHFQECGEIRRITIPADKYTQQSKG